MTNKTQREKDKKLLSEAGIYREIDQIAFDRRSGKITIIEYFKQSFHLCKRVWQVLEQSGS